MALMNEENRTDSSNIDQAPLLRRKFVKLMRKPVLLILIILVFSGLVMSVFLYKYYDWAINSPYTPDQGSGPSELSPALFTIRYGESATSVLARLEQEDLISSALLGKVYLRLSKKTVQAGEYQLPYGLSLVSLTDLLQRGVFEEPLTFIEGWRIEEYARKYADWRSAFDREEANSFHQYFTGFMQHPLVLEGSAEGYLFPDTYKVTVDSSLSELINRMYRRNQEVLSTVPIPSGLTQRQLVIFASLVEREAKYPSDRPIIAGILIKRWRSDMPLEVDATVQYALASERCSSVNAETCPNWWPPAEEGLDLDSPYNTRKYGGLPPGPICNPGYASLEAVANYQESPYWFYFSDSDGKMHYAETIDEHIRNIRAFSES